MLLKRGLLRLTSSDKLSTAIILLLLTAVLSISQVFQRIDYLLYDIGQQLFTQKAPDDVIIVAIDETSLSQLGRWPWSRDVHAQLINKLSQEGAKVIALDLVMSEPDNITPESDAKLAQAVKDAGNVVLPVLVERSRLNGQLVETLPTPEFAQHARGLGSVHVVLDEDGLARGFHTYEGLGGAAWPHFASAILQVAHELPPNTLLPSSDSHVARPYSLHREGYYKVNFSGPPGHFKHISYLQVLSGEFAPDTFREKIILVGATAVGMGDALPMPLTGLKQAMPGVEFHANILQAMRTHRLVDIVPKWLATGVCMLVAIIPLLFLPRTNAATGLLLATATFIAVALFATSLPPVLNIWVPMSASLASILLAYPIWSWRRLESATRFLDQQLRSLEDDLQAIGVCVQSKQNAPQDIFMQRIAQVKHAASTLRNLQQNRNETLAFISHDVRAPLATLLLQLDSGEITAEKMKQPLTRALKLVEDFLHISRAEMLDQQRYKRLDLTDLAHQALDDAYAIAQEKQLILKRDVSDDALWVEGESGLLHRAVLNLLLNAIKFSTPQSMVSLRVYQESDFACLQVIDNGVGIEPERLPYLFDRFYKAENMQQNKSGTGMGLHFVKTVIEKHHGKITVSSTPNVETCFSIYLPLV